MDKSVQVTMMGLGYIGLPTAALIASRKIQVTGVDINAQVIETVNKGEIHIIEPDLEGLVKYTVEKGYLKASTKATPADVYLIAVPTPFKDNHVPDLSYIKAVIENITPLLKEGDLVIIESTSPVGTTEKMFEFIKAKRPELASKIYFAYCPERVLPGKIIYELERNDRVIGGINEESTLKACKFYQLFVKGTLHRTNARTAEMCKLVENSSRDVNIAFANELSMICEQAQINVWELIELANRHPRVNILQPGPGVGGHCIAVDPWFIVNAYPKEAQIIAQARNINNYKTEWVIEKIKNTALQFELDNKHKPVIACMGLAFKPNIDDLRESPAKYIAEMLQNTEPDILLVEPNIETLAKGKTLTSTSTAMQKADIIVFLVAHQKFNFLKEQLSESKALVLDFCGFLHN
ncbi:UDP-N-acetyl-D-mannosamine dehydrogenase [Microscilla marina]|uniref:NDP-N-acetyl-D-galactosaminuronic acid dehydrogenase n=1 Tax=Microscilla marina ATCC 23134 TaxID=313606 RepID=A1ZTZ9_MICM2|nr:UDP-N-acetyl-D-mannosamine dehydrogenase [Microscilla marina]EAY26112.1 NDP-N-acetyl-D-galactosaminuronic acid dehydrogenase [Microscilla marina ATCC 23134]